MARREQQRLGKGLSALLGEHLTETAPDGALVETLPVGDLRPNPFQPRGELDPETLDELVDSIRENGLLQPLVVRPSGEEAWEIVAGERRWRAVKELGWSEIPAIVREIDDRTMLVLALIENLQREALTPLDEARAYRRLVDEFGLTQGEVAEQVGRDRSTVANTLRLLGLPSPVQDLLARGRISAGHARALLGLEDEDRAVELARQIDRSGLSVRDVERRVKRERGGGTRRSTTTASNEPDPAPYVRKAQQALARALGTDVRVKVEGADRGRLVIPFHDADDFERIVEVIVGVGGIV